MFNETFNLGYDDIRRIYWSLGTVFNILILALILRKMRVNLHGINSEFMNTLFFQYLMFMILYVPCYMCEFYSMVQSFGFLPDSFTVSWFSKIRLVEFFFNAIFLIFFVCEPYTRSNLFSFNWFNKCLPKKCRSSPPSAKSDPTVSFLNASMCTQLIQMILSGISISQESQGLDHNLRAKT